MRTLNFNTIKKTRFPVVLNDENQTKLLINPPTKSQMDRLEAIYKEISDGTSGEIEGSYELVAEVLSRNIQNYEITTEMLYDILDVEDVNVFCEYFKEFCDEIAEQKNL